MKKRKVIIVGLLALNLGLLSGCSLDKPFYFDFSRFVLEGEAEVQDVKVTGLNLDNTIIKSYEIEKIQENIDRDVKNDKLLRQMEWYPIHFWSNDVIKYCNQCVEEVICLIDDINNQ